MPEEKPDPSPAPSSAKAVKKTRKKAAAPDAPSAPAAPSAQAVPELTPSLTRKPRRVPAPKARAPKADPPATPAAKAPAPKRARKPAAPKVAAPVSPGVPAAVTPAAKSRATITNEGAGPLSVLMVTPEAHPFAKTGGLAEVTAALSDALVRLEHAVTLVVPRYRGIDVAGTDRLQTRIRLGDRLQPVSIFEKQLSGKLTVALVDVPELFDRDGLYGTAAGDYADNAWRFAVFSRAALEYPRLKEWRPSIVHAHDWQTGLVPVYQKMQLSSDPFVGGVPTVFTLHNLAFQGIFPASTLPDIGLTAEVLHVQAMEFWGSISYLKGGINFSEQITTVSPGYAREIVQPELGFGLDGVLARRGADLSGIVNGIDTSRWTPSDDPYLAAGFTADDLSGKREAKRELLASAGLPTDGQALDRPVIGLISRLTEQKGFDLIAAASADLMALDASWVMLGSGERRFEEQWRALAALYPDRVAATIGFDERRAHLIEAGSDLFLMPSRFEPCGLNQLYSLRYGTVPVVRATGGLDDTVRDADESPETGTGFKFRDYTPGALVATVRRALAAHQDTDRWQALQRRGMREDHSWDASAAEYVKLYGRARADQQA